MTIDVSDLGSVVGIVAVIIVVVFIFSRGFSQNSKLHGSGKDKSKSETAKTITDSSKKQ
jgi:hypothetical protein